MKLRTHISLSLGPIMLLQLLILIVPIFFLYKGVVGDQIKNHISDTVAQLESSLDTKVSRLIADSEVLSQNSVLNRYINIEDESTRSYIMNKTLVNEFTNFNKVHPEYIEVSFLTTDGFEEVSLLVSDSDNLSFEEEDTEYYKRIVNSKNRYEIIVMVDPNTQKWVLVLAKKLFIKEKIERTRSTENKLAGYLIVKLPFTFLDYFIQNISLAVDGFVVLYNDRREPIIESGQVSLGQALLKQLDNNIDILQTKDVFEYQLDREIYLVGHQKVHTDLHFIIGWPESKIKQMLFQLGMNSFVGSAILFIISIFLLYWMLNKILIVPILNLQNEAKKMGSGHHQWDFRKTRSDEIMELASSVKEMGESLALQQQKMREIAYSDSLTELRNRLYFKEELERQFNENVLPPSDVALLFLDLDGFKHVNDTVGHEAGDKVLVIVAKRLRFTLRSSDLINCMDRGSDGLKYSIARLGGDEFTVIVNGINKKEDIIPVVERILTTLKQPIHLESQMFQVGASIGVALSSEGVKSASELIRHSDIAMYEAKMQGKNTYCFFSNKSAART